MVTLALRQRMRGYHVTRVKDGAKLGIVYDVDEMNDTIVEELRRLGFLPKRRYAEAMWFDRQGDAMVIVGNWDNFLLLTATVKG